MKSLGELTELVIKFRDARNWKQFHNPKDSAMGLMLESAEVMEHFLWKNEVEMQKQVKEKKEEIGDELADVLYWILLMSHDFKIDLSKAFIKKLAKSGKKYPIKKSRGKHTKYTDL